jgi:Tol biopolymer transport system component
MSRRFAAVGAAAMLATLVVAPTATATFPDRNGRIAFWGETDAGQQLFTIKANGHDLRQVTHLDGDAGDPDWSPDGRRLAFDFNECSVAFVDADGANLRVLPIVPAANGSTDICETDPSYLADGEHVLYERYDPSIEDDAIWTMRVDGTERHRILGGGAADINASPDGTRMTFKSGDVGALYVANIDGSGKHQIGPVLPIGYKHDWAPDGSRIVVTDIADPEPGQSVNVLTFRPDGTDVRYLTHNTDGNRANSGAWSPDGQWILMRLATPDGPIGLFRIRPDGSDLHEIVSVDELGGLVPRFTDWGPAAH